MHRCKAGCADFVIDDLVLVLLAGRGLSAALPATRDAAARPTERLAGVGEAIDLLRGLDGDTHSPVLVAAGGPRARALAAEKADIVTLAAGPLASRVEVAHMVNDVRAHAGHRADDIEFSMSLFVIGDDVPPWTAQFIGADAATLIAHDSLTMLRGSVQEMADELQRRRENLGISYVCVNAAHFEQLAPVVEILTGH